VAAGQAPAIAAQPTAAAQSGCLIPLLSFLCPSPPPATGTAAAASPTISPTSTASPTATVSPTATASPAATASPGAGGTALPSAAPDPSPSPGTTVNPSAHRKAAAPALTAAAVPATLTAGSAVMNGLSYDGVAPVQTANGPQRMLKFSMNSLRLSGGITLSVREGGHTTVTRNSSIHFSGSVVLYATRMCGDLLGIRLCFTPQSPPPLVVPVMVFTNVVTDQPLTAAAAVSADGLRIAG